MADKPDNNEGFRVLEEFICAAKPGPGIPATPSPGRGANAGMRLIAEFVAPASHSPMPEEWKAELRQLDNSQLLALVQCGRSALTPEELRFIHEIAIQRLTQSADPFAKDADELCRAVMHEAVNRLT